MVASPSCNRRARSPYEGAIEKCKEISPLIISKMKVLYGQGMSASSLFGSISKNETTSASAVVITVRSNDRVERAATTPLAACRASQQPVGNQGAAHDSPRSALTHC